MPDNRRCEESQVRRFRFWIARFLDEQLAIPPASVGNPIDQFVFVRFGDCQQFEMSDDCRREALRVPVVDLRVG